jgi:hypothetical protein
VVNTLAPPGLVARIHSDYDRDGSLAADDPEDQVRLLRPGAIILPNLDISDSSRLPPVPATGAAPDLIPLLDFTDTIVNGTVDQGQLTVATFEFPPNIASRAASVSLRIDARDAARIRGFATATFALFALPPTALLGDGNAEVLLESSLGTFLLGSATDPTILLEALAPPGDPTRPAPTGPSPRKPNPFTAKLPAGSSGAPVLAKRAPGDVWMEIVHTDSAGKEIARPRDVALFTIAPLLFLPGTLPPKRVFVVNAPEIIGPPGSGFLGRTVPGNHNFIFDLTEGCQAVFGAAAVPLPANDSAPFTPSTPASTGPFYLIDGTKFPDIDKNGNVHPLGLPDPWIQDEIEIGYCFAPHASMHVVLHCKRNRGLHKFVHQEMAAPSVGVYDGLHAPEANPADPPGTTPEMDGVNYGGNIEATPPITAATPALGAGAAGPAVKAHKPAPFGKILLGDSRVRKVEADYREFLLEQIVQPVLPVDTSWLSVGHVDEFVSFVADGSAKGFKMLTTSVNAMTVLLEEAKKVPVSAGRTNLHRGKWNDPLRVTAEDYEEISVESLLNNSKKFNDTLRANHLIPIDQRLKAGLNLTETDIIRIPTYFRPPAVPRPAPVPPRPGTADLRTMAQTIGTVNMLVLGKDLMIPKPFGPRMKTTDAEAVLNRVFKKLGIKAPVRLPATGEVRWVEPDETPERMVCYYTDAPTDADRQNIIAHIKDPVGKALSPSNVVLVLARAAEIAAAPANAANGLLLAQLVSVFAGTPAALWFKVTIPDNKVDVLEAYILSVLGPLGVTVHFVDDWFYHSGVGEAHCATNCLRALPEDSDAKRWWDKYDPSVDVRYSP